MTMNNVSEEITDAAIEKLKNGSSLEEVLLSYPDYRTELEPILQIAVVLQRMPKANVPAYTMQRKYIFAEPKPNVWLTWLHMSRFIATSMSLLLFIVAVSSTAYASFKSLPGQTFFPIKKAVENIQVSLTTNPEKKATKQLALAQQRLADAQTIFNNPNHNQAQEQAALNELSDQTTQTITIAKTTEVSNVLTQTKDHPLVASLEGLAAGQQELLNRIKPTTNTGTEVSIAANTAEQANQEVTKFIKVIAASTNDTSLVNLTSTSTLQQVSGILDKITSTSIMLNKTTFLINTSTPIKTSSGTALSLTDLLPKMYITVTATGTKPGTSALSITINKKLDIGIVKGAYTDSTSTDSKMGATSSSDSTKRFPFDTDVDTTTSSPITDQAQGGFIIEDPAPQYVP